jgi:hypothetical protein
MPSTVDYCGNHPPLSPVTPPAQDLPDTDDFFERTLTDIIDGKYLVVVQGFANSEYAQPEGLKLALTQQLLTTRDAQNGRRIVVIGGGSDASIGVVYALAQELGMTTAGIYLEGALDTTHCDRFVEVKHVPGTSDQGTVMPTSGEDLFVAAMRIANGPRGAGGTMLCFGADSPTEARAKAAHEAGYDVTLFREHWPQGQAAVVDYQDIIGSLMVAGIDVR